MRSGKTKQRGFTYVAVLVLVALMGGGLAAYGELASHGRQREREAELVWIGNQFREAIGLYYQRTPGAVKRYPEKLEDLLEDKRFLTRQRYLRRLYVDPITGSTDWGLAQAAEGGIKGIHSLSTDTPISAAASNWQARGMRSYREWHFLYETPLAPTSDQLE